MDYQIKHYNSKRGFSMVELIVVLGIFALLFEIGTSAYNSFKSHSNLEMATNGLVEAVRFAQSNAQSGKEDSKWGVEILPGGLVVFKGISYVSRDTSFDQTLNFAREVTSSGLSEIVFEKVTGITLNFGTTTLSNGLENKDIYINAKGTIIY